MKLLIIGGSGVIGSYLIKHFVEKGINVEFTYLKNNFINITSNHKLDITSYDSTINLISKINPDVVIHTAALTNVDECERNPTLAKNLHVKGTSNIIEACKLCNSKIVYVSTSFVFDGTKDIYYEDDIVSPSNHYGLTKQQGEELITNSGLDYLIARTDQPYCWSEPWQHTNSVQRILENIERNQIHREISDWYNTPTFVPDFVNSLSKLLEYNKKGIYHLVGSDFLSRYEWSLITAEIFGLNKDMIEPVNSKSLQLPVKRGNVHVSNEKLQHEIGIKMIGIKEGLLQMKNNGLRNHEKCVKNNLK